MYIYNLVVKFEAISHPTSVTVGSMQEGFKLIDGLKDSPSVSYAYLTEITMQDVTVIDNYTKED